MKHARKMGRPGGAALAVVLLALGVLGVALAGVARHELAAEVKVTLTDTKLVVDPASLPPGRASFVFVNKGKLHHVLKITGPGLDGARMQKVAPRSIETLPMKLVVGTYRLADSGGAGGPIVGRLIVRSATAGAQKSKPVPQRPPTTEIAPTGVGCDV